MEALPQEMRDAIGELDSVASALFASMDVSWWIRVVPDGFAGPEIELRVSVGEGRATRRYKLAITHAFVINERDQLRTALVERVRTLREGMRE